jgi:glyoxylase-like metal-dependent hydrolase (beta-lactamase superfamily II)
MRGKGFALTLLVGSLVAPVRGSAQSLNGGLAGVGIIPGLNLSSAIKVLPVRGNIYVLMGAGANITLSVGLDGVLMVDSGSAEMSDQVITAIRAIQLWVEAKNAASAPPVLYGAETRNSIIEARRADMPPKPIRYIVATSIASDHIGGNVKIAGVGQTFTGGNVAGQLNDVGQGAAIVGHENLQNRMANPPAGQPAFPTRALPTDTYPTDAMKLSNFFNGEGIILMHQPSAFTDGDTIVYFRGSDVIAAGEVFRTTTYPVIDMAKGGTINGVVEGLNHIIDLSVPEFRSEGGTIIIPAYGRISDIADVAYYRDMVTILRDRIQDMLKKGMTLEQVKAARPAADYDGRYGATGGPWTTDMFIEAVYKTLPREPAARPAAPAAAAPKRGGSTK